MKKLLLLFIMISGFAFGQEIITNSKGKTIQLNADKTWQEVDNPVLFSVNDLSYNEKGSSIINKTITLKDGVNNLVPVEFDVFVLKEFEGNINFKKLDLMMETARVKAKYSLKNKNTFRPMSVSIYSSKENEVDIMMKFLGENDYGAKKDSLVVVTFDKDGNEVKNELKK